MPNYLSTNNGRDFNDRDGGKKALKRWRQTLLEAHLKSRIRDFEEEEAQKILDLEEELAGLNLDKGPMLSNFLRL